jgi:hypothetical protein
MSSKYEVISAFLDDETFAPQDLAAALSEPDGRTLLIDLISVRGIVQPSDPLPAMKAPSSHRRLPVTHYPLPNYPSTDCRLPIRQLAIADYLSRLSIANGPAIAHCRFHIADAGTEPLLPRPLEPILIIREENVETSERSVAPGDVALEADLDVVGEIRGVDLLLERAQAIAQHHDLVEEGFDRPAFFLQAGRPRPEDERPASPLFGGRDGREAGLLADHTTEQALEIG